MEAFDIPAHACSLTEQIIKKSRFITFLAHTEGVAAAREFLHQTKAAHPTARHHCWAWVAGAPDDHQQLGYSDDGEPAGTAGKPMLAQLRGSQVGEITAVVVRYYGGIQLGTGGLVKAYGGSVQQGLAAFERQRKVIMQFFHLMCDYSQLAEIERIINQFGGQILKKAFFHSIHIELGMPVAKITYFLQSIKDFSRGTLTPVPR